VPQRFYLLVLCLFAGLLGGAAQPRAGGAGTLGPVRVGALPDGPYAWASIRTDTALVFRATSSLRPAQARRYWLKLAVPNHSRYTEDAQLTVLPNLDNTLFYYDEDARAWRTQRAGVAVATDSQRIKGRLALRLPGRATTTCYVLVRLSEQASLPPAIRLQASLEPAAVPREADAFFRLAWAVSLAVVALLLLTNVLAYSRRPDRLTLYYGCTQVGAMLYITAFRGYFKVLWPGPVFSQLVRPTGLSYGYNLNNLFMHLSVVLMLIGCVQMTRAYLPIRARLPRLDTALRYALRGYCAFAAVVGLVNVSGFYLNQYTLLYDNLLVLGLVGLLLATTVAAYQRQLPLARPYLLANALPLLFILLNAAYHVVVGFDNNGNQLLPDLAIVAHALGFSAAINLRLQALQQTLLATEREAAILALDIRQQELRHREIVLKNGHIQTALLEMQRRQQARDEHAQQLSTDHQRQQTANHELRTQLEANQRELASTTLYVQQKNALLAELRQQMQELGAQSPIKRSPELAGIQSLLQASQYLDEDWGRFKLHFEQVHPRFFEELQARYPALTSHEQRLYCYFHIQLSTKEIAALLNIDPASVRRAKTRLYKKIAAADEAAGRPAAGQAVAAKQPQP
jgi:DNA-binding NarL/FixJ family response regulator